jgi:hypothetical protein
MQALKRVFLWIGIALFYVWAQAALYAQDRSSPQTHDTPWEHLTLEGALIIAVGVQYRENRARELNTLQMAKDAAAAMASATKVMESVTTNLEKLSSKVDACPVRLEGYRRPPTP